MKSITKILLLSKLPLWLASTLTNPKRILIFKSNKYPLQTQGCLEHKPVFILGSGRSGNTLLRSMLISGNQISIPPESYVIPKCIRTFKGYSYKPWGELCEMIVGVFKNYKEFYTWGIDLSPAVTIAKSLPKDKRTLANILDCIYREYSKQLGFDTPIWGDKTPINSVYSSWITKVFPEAKYIHLIRDPAAVAVSYKKSGLYNDLNSGLKFWKRANKEIEKVKKNQDFVKVTYEGLVTNPEKELKVICKHCELTYTDNMLNYYKNHEKLGDTVHHKHHKNTSKKLTTANIDSWKAKVSKEELSFLNNWKERNLNVN
ncbi:sulfotransferase family protein [Kangiella sediminilitoris]|uniref:Sulfotransferase n=1 Tax=Kangiella sediminilitoris TaxID=1144748 RepID=A0A1B3BBJ2_9GAMM|nr:sulfotransferase [Kangiella sediminilitoris]AOE50165.1 Sulfotransferase [Kangiella sediminilitoris]